MKDHNARWLQPMFDHRHAADGVAAQCAQSFEHMLTVWVSGLRNSGKLIFFGNGGSQAMAQHFAAECVVRYRGDRKPIPAIALSTDPSVTTAIGNDMDFNKVFERQIEALAGPHDVLVALTTSGKSSNVLTALEYAVEEHITATAFLGPTLGIIPPIAATIMVPSNDTARIQEMHLMLGHMLIAALEKELELV